METQLTTPPSCHKKKPGRSKSRGKSPGDLLGSGKFQVPITRFYSPDTFSSEKNSQSPLSCVVQRQYSEETPLPKKKHNTMNTLTQTRKAEILLSGDVSGQSITEDPCTNLSPLDDANVPLSQLNLVRRCLYPETSQIITSSTDNSSRPKKKILAKMRKKRKSRVLSSEDSSEDVPDQNWLTDVKLLRSSQTSPVNNMEKRLHLKTPSCVVVISSSEDSDFELHNSKKSHNSSANQTIHVEDSSKSRLEICLSPQMNCNDMLITDLRVSSEGKTPDNSKNSNHGPNNSVLIQADNLNTTKERTISRYSPSVRIAWQGDPINDSSDIERVKGSSTLANTPALLSGPTIDPSDKEIDGDATFNLGAAACDSEAINKPSSSKNVPSIYLRTTIPVFSPCGSNTTNSTDEENEELLPPFISHSDLDTTVELHADKQILFYSQTKNPLAPSEDDPIYDEVTIDPLTEHNSSSSSDSQHFNTKPNLNSKSLSNQHKSKLPRSSSKYSVVDQSDDKSDEFIWDQNPLGISMASRKGDESSLGVIPLTDLLDVSHISDSGGSDSLDEVYSDIDATSVDVGNRIFPERSDYLLHQMLVDESQDSSRVSTPVVNAVVDASADFFSDVISSLSPEEHDPSFDVESGLRPGKRDSNCSVSQSEGCINESLDGGQARLSEVGSSVGVRSRSVSGQSTKYYQMSSLVDSTLFKNPDSLDTPDADPHIISNLHPSQVESSDHKSEGDSCIIMEDSLGSSKESLTSNREGSLVQSYEKLHSTSDDSVKSPCAGNDNSIVDLTNSMNEAQSMDEMANPTCPIVDLTNSKNEAQSAKYEVTDPSNPIVDLTDSIDQDLMDRLIKREVVSANTIPNDTQIVCGSQPPDCLTKLQISQAMEDSLLQNPKQSLLLDIILSECYHFAEPVLSAEPLKTFVSQYSRLTSASKTVLHHCLLQLLNNSNCWVKLPDSSSAVDNLVSSGFLQYLDQCNDVVAKLNSLTYFEISDILCKLGNSPVKCAETMKNIILNKFSSSYTCERVKTRVIELINRKFLKLTPNSLLCIKICVELFAVPLNLNNKLYKTIEIVKYLNSLLKDIGSNKILLTPLKTSSLLGNPGRVLTNLADLCRLKSEAFESELNDESISLRVNRICAEIAVLEFSCETEPSLKTSPTFRYLLASYVHALEEQLKKFLYLNSSDIECTACVYLGFLVKQNVTGYPQKVKWYRERLRFLSKLQDTTSVFEKFSKILKEPVSPVEFFVRSDFVSNALSVKKIGLSIDEKSKLTKMLRPIVHKRARITPVQLSCSNYYKILNKSRGKNLNFARACVFENYKADYPRGAEDNGGLIFNAIFLVFWQVIYLQVDGVFVSKFQSSPLDWGSAEFYTRREHFLGKFVSDLKKYGLRAVLKLIKSLFEKFFAHRCVVDWTLVAGNLPSLLDVVEILGLDRFIKIGLYVLGKADERVLGFPEIIIWNEEAKTIKLLGLKKPSDSLYPYQVLWLEKLLEFGVDAEECRISGPEPCRQMGPDCSLIPSLLE